MTVLLEILSWLCIVGGAFFCLVGGLGLLRLPDFFSRMHGAALTDTMGAGLLMVGLMLQAGLSLITIKLLAILFFLLLTSPTATHALAKAALAAGSKPFLKGADQSR